MRLICGCLFSLSILIANTAESEPALLSHLAPFDYSSLVPIDAVAATKVFQGQLSLSTTTDRAKMALAGQDKLMADPRRLIPTMVFDVVQNAQNEIIPQQRSLSLSTNPYWDYLVGVGKIWQTDSKTQQHRIALPFALIEKNENCTHNGILLFSLDEQNQAADFYYQISSETCAYFKADLWGSGDVSFDSQAIPDAHELVSQYQQEKSHRLTTRPIKELSTLATDIVSDSLALKTLIEPQDMTFYGVVYQDIHYVSECLTRAGNYPFCEQLVMPSYSSAKSVFAGLSMFYLQQLYSDVFEQNLSQWVPQCSGKQWQDVNFSDLLNMTTGNYVAADYGVDEGAKSALTFFTAKTHTQRLKFACDFYPHKSAPGTQFVYHSSDTYLLGTALNNYLSAKLGKTADVFNDIVLAKIFKPLQLSPVTYVSRRTQDSVQQAYAGYGLFFTRDDLMRISRFIHQQANLPTSVLAQTQLQEALQHTPSARGLSTDYSHIRYQHSFWARNINKLVACDNDSWLPFMSGFGGITVALLPQNTSYYYVNDSHQYNWAAAIPELNKLHSLCTEQSPLN